MPMNRSPRPSRRASALCLLPPVVLAVAVPRLLALERGAEDGPAPETFRDPPRRFRPLQIVHGLDSLGPGEEEAARRLRELEALGLGGLVANVSFRDYLRSETQWQLFCDRSRRAHELGFELWLYDEDGYPSGAAGGLVLESDEGLEALGLARRLGADGKPTYQVERMYQGTHSTENVYKKRRYINLLEPRATARFIELTHQAYASRISELARRFRAIFTDEPSLVTTYIRPPADALPAIPWSADLPAAFRERQGYDLEPHLESLFTDTGDHRGLRCDFYDLIAQLLAERYFGQIREWCRGAGIASTGHLLAEESLVWHVEYYGDVFPSLRRLDIPGIDILNSRPEDLLAGGGFLTPKLAASAAHLEGARQTMSETSDFSQQQAGRQASHRERIGTANLIYLLGINTITSYYRLPSAPGAAREYKQYNDHVARLGAMLRPAHHRCDVAVLYPVSGVQANFYPTPLSMYAPHPNETARRIDEDFRKLCQTLLRHQIDFDILPEAAVHRARADEGRLAAGTERYRVLVIPPTDTIHQATAEHLERLAAQGVPILGTGLRPRFAAGHREHAARVAAVMDALLEGERFVAGPEALIPKLHALGCDDVVLEESRPQVLAAHYRRGSHEIYFVTSAAGERTSFPLSLRSTGPASLWHPETGEVREVDFRFQGGRLRGSLDLAPHEGVFLLTGAAGGEPENGAPPRAGAGPGGEGGEARGKRPGESERREGLEEARAPAAPRADPGYRAAVLQDSLPGSGPALGREIARELSRRGLAVETIGAGELCDAARIEAAGFDLLVLPGSARLPLGAGRPVEAFLARGGDVLALEAPAFSDPVWRAGEEWVSWSEWRHALERQETARILFDFEDGDLSAWQRFSSTPDAPVSWRIAAGPRGRALEARIPDLQGWETFASPELEAPFPPGHELTCLWARGSPETRSLSLEWREKDGSRWIAVFPVTETWRRVVLAPRDFKFWQSVAGRGGEEDSFRPENAARLLAGVAWSHTGPRGGRYDFALDEIGTAPSPLGQPPAGINAPAPPVEGLSPAFKFYELRDVARLRPRFPWVLPGKEILPVPPALAAHHPRPTGKGTGKARGWRWVPLLEALGPAEEWRGAPAAIFLDFDGPLKGSARAAFAVADPSWYREPPVLDLLGRTARRLARGLFFREAGTELFTYRPGEPVRCGAAVANLSRRDAPGLAVRLEIVGEGGGTPVATDERIDVPAGREVSFLRRVNLPEGADRFTLRALLLEGGEVLDEVRHEIGLSRPRPAEARRFVTVRDGDFWLDGRKWYVHGVNYMPSTGIALESRDTFEYWLGAPAYDPEFVGRDLERCRELGFNAVSVFIYRRSLEAGNLADLLRQCEPLGFKVNLSLRPGTPMAYEPPWWEDTIRRHRLWENDTIFAYDIAWEPFFGTEAERRRHDPEWRRWVEARYGSLAAAGAAWGVEAPRHQGKLSTPIAHHLGRDGPHRKLVADYRRFADELVHGRYQEAADRIRRLDPHHLVSFRMTVTGDPTFDGSHKMPYDFPGVARSMDFMAPEGYGRIGDWERVKPGLFTVAYARACAPGKPVVWAEAGVSAWDPERGEATRERLEFQGRFYEDFYRLVLASGANGVIWWWYPGGYRTGERSDYGVIEPDGTDRPAARAIRRHGPRVLVAREIPEPEVWIEIDRDADARGLEGMYERVKDRFWEAVAAGKVPGLVPKRPQASR